MIDEERLNEEKTRKYVENTFRDGVIKTTGTDIDQLLPAMSRFGFGGGNREQKKQGVIDKLKAFFDKYFGLGITNFTKSKKTVTYDFEPQQPLMVAEDPVPYGRKTDE